MLTKRSNYSNEEEDPKHKQTHRKDSLTDKIHADEVKGLKRVNNIDQKKMKAKLINNEQAMKKIKKTFKNNKSKSQNINSSDFSNQDDESEIQEASSIVFSSELSSDDQIKDDKKKEHKVRRGKHVQKTQLELAKMEDDEDTNMTIMDEQIQQVARNQINSTFLIYPDSTFRQLWDFISFFLILAISLYIPFIFAFDIDASTVEGLKAFEVFLDCWFLVEIFVNFFTGYFEKGIVIMDRKKIFINYLKTWFIVDMISSIPFSFVYFGNSEASTNFQALKSAKLIRILRMAKYARLVRLIRFLKVNKLMQSVEEFIVNEFANLLMRFLKLSIMLFFVAHWHACLLFKIGADQKAEVGNTWLYLHQIQDEPIMHKYVTALYWAFTTMMSVGYGDLHPCTTKERLITIFCMINSSIVFAFIIGDIGKMVGNFSMLAASFRERMTYVESFLRQKNIPQDLRIKVKRYLEYNYEMKKLYCIEENEVLSLLNINLRGKITVYLNGRILQNIHVLNKFPIEFLSNLSFILKKKTYGIDENLINEGDMGQDLYFIVTGRVSIIHKRSTTHIKDLEKDLYFGEIAFFSDLPRQCTVKGRDFTDVFTIQREDFLQMALQVSESAMLLYHKIRQTIDENPKDFKQLGLICYLCNTVGHIAIDCKQFQRTIKGNLKRYYKKLNRMNSQMMATDIDYNRNQTPQKNVSLMTTVGPKNGLKANMTLRDEDNMQEVINERHNGISLSNLVAFPEEMMKDISEIYSDDQEDEDFDISKLPNLANLKQKQISSNSSIRKSSSSGILSKLSMVNMENSFSQSPERIDVPSFKYVPKKHSTKEPTTKQKKNIKAFANQKKLIGGTSTTFKDVIKEEDEEQSLTDDDTQPFLTQRRGKAQIKPPKIQNDLTKIVGKRKRFNSKEFRESKLKDLQENLLQDENPMRRTISIRSGRNMKHKIQTVIKKTYTTLVETYTKKEMVEYEKKNEKKSKMAKAKSQETEKEKSNREHDKKDYSKQNSFYINVFEDENGEKDEKHSVEQKESMQQKSSSILDVLDTARIKTFYDSINVAQKEKKVTKQSSRDQLIDSLIISLNEESDADNSFKKQQTNQKQESQNDAVNGMHLNIKKQTTYEKKEEVVNTLMINDEVKKNKFFSQQSAKKNEKWSENEERKEKKGEFFQQHKKKSQFNVTPSSRSSNVLMDSSFEAESDSEDSGYMEFNLVTEENKDKSAQSDRASKQAKSLAGQGSKSKQQQYKKQ